MVDLFGGRWRYRTVVEVCRLVVDLLAGDVSVGCLLGKEG